MSETPADPTLHELVLEIRDEIVRLRTLLAELRPVPLLPLAAMPFELERIGERQPVRLGGTVHQPWCHLAGPWHGVIPPSCTCGADPQLRVSHGTDESDWRRGVFGTDLGDTAPEEPTM